MYQTYERGYLEINDGNPIRIFLKEIEVFDFEKDIIIGIYDVDIRINKINKQVIAILNDIYYQNKRFHIITYNNNEAFFDLFVGCYIDVPVIVSNNQYDILFSVVVKN